MTMKPKIRPKTISLMRTGLVTIVCSVRFLISAGRLNVLRNKAITNTK